MLRLPFLLIVCAASALGAAPPLDAESYNQWKAALKSPDATPASEVRALPGFTVELLRSARPEEGSWVAMAIDEKGRVVLAREERGLLRLSLPDARMEVIEDTLLEVRGLLFAHGALFANANNSRGLYRLRDTDGDERLDEVKLLRATPGGVGHGRNQLALGPDVLIYSIHGDDVLAPEGGFTPGSPFAHFREDKLLPAAWDKFAWSTSVRPPAGHVVRTDADGTRWEIVCGGLRNPFGLAFNADGDLFTYDADMEWDVGLPWYRPTRILHLVSGADYGWRGGTRALPAWMSDTWPAAVDLGKGSPTAIVFGTRSRWPEPWRNALFALDWAYGRVHAVHLAPRGASYTGRSETFLEGRPLNVTGAAFGPDGELYLITGGRRTRSGLYRVKWAGGEPKDRRFPIADPPLPHSGTFPKESAERQRLESFHGRAVEGAVASAWPHLASDDPWLRHAARVALEVQPLEAWSARALAEAQPEALLALARVGGVRLQPPLLERLGTLDLQRLSPAQQLTWLRALEVSLLRDEPGAAAHLRPSLEAAFPAADPRVNRLLCELLVFTGSPVVVEKTLPLLEHAAQEDRLHFLLTLRGVQSGWNVGTRRDWLRGLHRAKTESIAGPALLTNLNHARGEFEAALSADDKAALAREFAALDVAAALPGAPEPRPFVRAWTIEELLPAPVKTDASRGRALFNAASCALCHRVGGEGGTLGPDLTDVGRRLDRRALLEALIEPSRVVAEQYRTVSLQLRSGAVVDGRLVSEDATHLHVAPNPIEPDSHRHIPRADIAKLTQFSAMPPGLLDTLTREEIHDLLAWLEAAH